MLIFMEVAICSVPVEAPGAILTTKRSEGQDPQMPKGAISSLNNWAEKNGFKTCKFYDIDMLYPSDEEIEKMVQDAELHAEEDRKAREVVDARNNGEAMIHTVRKTLSEAGEKVEAEEKSQIEEAITNLEAAIKGDDTDDIKAKTDALMQSSHKLAERMYQEQAADVSPDNGSSNQANDSAEGQASDDVVDAEFEEVKDGKD